MYVLYMAGFFLGGEKGGGGIFLPLTAVFPPFKLHGSSMLASYTCIYIYILSCYQTPH